MTTSELSKNRDASLVVPGGIAVANVPNVSGRMQFRGVVPTARDVIDIGMLGGGIRLVSESKRELTHSAACKFLELAEFVVAGKLVDRNLKNSHVENLIVEMKQGTFFAEWVCLMSCVCLEACGDTPAGVSTRINGQHVCWARLEMPASWPCLVKFMNYEAQTVNDMRLLYASCDGNKVRTYGDKINSYVAGVDGFEDCSATILRSLAAGVKLWLTLIGSRADKCNNVKYATAVAYQLLRERKELAMRVKAFLSGLTTGEVTRQTGLRAPIVAAMYETYSVLAGAGEFWDVVSNGLGASGVNDPRFRLHNTLRESIVGSSSASASKDQHTGKRVVSQATMFAQCVNCWNAWRRGEPLKVVKGMTEGRVPRAK